MGDIVSLNREMNEANSMADEAQKENPYLGKFIRDRSGNIKKTSLTNIEIILEFDSLFRGAFAYNEFTYEKDVVRSIPEIGIQSGQMLDRYYTFISSYIEKQKKYNNVCFDNNQIARAMDVVAQNHAYNPVIDYFEQCESNWDGKNRIDIFFQTFLGAEERQEIHWIAHWFFSGAVAKVYNPFTKFDLVLDLVGGQGAGKTTLLQKIAPLELYTDQFNSFTEKDDFSAMKKAVIVNDDEMTVTNKTSFESLKKFITLQEFEYRKAYARESERFHKKFLLTRTTNEVNYLKDKTGERRFMPILVDKKNQILHPVSDLNQEYIDQLWGEAVHLYKNGEISLHPTKEQEEVMEEYRHSFMYSDEVEDELDILLANKFKDRTFIASSEIAFELTGSSNLVSNRKLANKITYLMVNQFGFEKTNGRLNGKKTRGFKR